jgi:hypothetical protein
VHREVLHVKREHGALDYFPSHPEDTRFQRILACIRGANDDCAPPTKSELAALVWRKQQPVEVVKQEGESLIRYRRGKRVDGWSVDVQEGDAFWRGGARRS